MITFDTVQQAIVNSTTKHINWLFDIDTYTPNATYYWSTKNKNFEDDTAYQQNSYTFKIIADSFSGITLNRAKSELGIQTPNEITFQVTNANNVLTASDFIDGLVLIRLVGSKYNPAEMLTNPGFETYTGTPNDGIQDSFTGWTITGTTGYIDAITVSPHSGSACIKINSGNPYDRRIQQTVTVVPETYYSFSFFSKLGADLNTGACGVYDNTHASWIVPLDTIQGITSDTTWNYSKTEFYTPAGCISISVVLACHNINSNVYFDDVSLTYAEVELRSWAFSVTRCESSYQTLTFTCEDILQRYIKGDYPNTGLLKNLFKTNSNLIDDNYCVPKVFGTTAYIPLRLLITGSGNDYYFLGSATDSFTINKQRVPRGAQVGKYEWADINNSTNYGGNIIINGTFATDLSNWTYSAFEWYWNVNGATGNLSDTSALEQTSATVIIGGGYKLTFDIAGITGGSVTPSCGGVTGSAYSTDGVGITYNFIATATTHLKFTPTIDFDGAIDNVILQPIINAYVFTQSTITDDTGISRKVFVNNINDGHNIIFVNGDHWFDVATELDGTSQYPSTVINLVFNDLKGSNYNILNAQSIVDATVIYTTWGLIWNGGLYKTEPTEKIIGKLLNMCHSTLITNGLYAELKTLSKTSQKTITKAEVLKTSDQGFGTFKYSAITKDIYDSGYVAYQELGEAQDEFIQILVPTKQGGTIVNPSSEVLELPFIGDSVTAQKLGILYYQRKYLKIADISFSAKGTLLALQPDDVITINDTDYGGNYPVLIESISIKKDLVLEFHCIEFSETLDDYTDLSPTAITLTTAPILHTSTRNYAATYQRAMELFTL